jgi:hypothetical protein
VVLACPQGLFTFLQVPVLLLFAPLLQEEKNSSDRYVDTQKWKYQHHTDWVTCVK